MADSDVSRRGFVKQSLATMAPAMLGASALPIPARGDEPAAARLSILCIGAHPDDPESGCGGTLARYAAAGHAVKILYLTRGERGIDGKSLDDAAHIRTLEAEAACVVIGATPMFYGQIDGATEITHAHVASMTKLVATEKPDVVFTHWPVDTHMDHQIASVLAMRACIGLRAASVYFFEVNAGSQTSAFKPDTYVDISTVLEKKKAALLAHASQDGAGIWRMHHEPMSQWRGREMGSLAAEGFVRWRRGQAGDFLPGV
jgi:LmbE family N-acetylglucosaminyl deacetylase